MRINKKIKLIIIGIIILTFIFFSLKKSDMTNEISGEQQSETQIAENESTTKKEENIFSYIHIGTSNIVVILLLTGTLAGVNIKRIIDEKQKETGKHERK